MADTLTINVRDIRYSNTVHVRIPIINKTNPCFGYDATEDQIRQLMSIPNYEIRDAATGVIINGHNLQEYFPSGGGGGGGVTPQIVQSMINASIDSTVSDTSTKAVQNAAITNFVNSSIESSTADFKGTYDSKAEMNEVTANQNDYAFLRVLNNDGSVNHYERYKWSNTEVSGSHWLFEYNVNNSSFTAEQWAAINSAITSGDVEKLAALPTKAQLDALLAAKQDTLTFDNLPTQNSNNPVKSGGVFTALGSKAEKVLVVQVVFPSLSEGEIYEMLHPNKIAEVSFVDYMNFAFGGIDNTQKCEYCIKFDVGSTIPTLTLPNEIIWAEELELEANTHYVLLINYENGALYGDWKAYPLT